MAAAARRRRGSFPLRIAVWRWRRCRGLQMRASSGAARACFMGSSGKPVFQQLIAVVKSTFAVLAVHGTAEQLAAGIRSLVCCTLSVASAVVLQR